MTFDFYVPGVGVWFLCGLVFASVSLKCLTRLGTGENRGPQVSRAICCFWRLVSECCCCHCFCCCCSERMACLRDIPMNTRTQCCSCGSFPLNKNDQCCHYDLCIFQFFFKLLSTRAVYLYWYILREPLLVSNYVDVIPK